MDLLIIGAGAREHALAWKLSQSDGVRSIYVCPGNAGTTGVNKTLNIELDITEHDAIGQFCVENHIDLVVVGPEDPLDRGIVDDLTGKYGVRCFGPTKQAALIESSKAFAKDFMRRHGIPSPEYKVVTNDHEALNVVQSFKSNSFAVKASGLCAGKGVVIAENRADALRTAVAMLARNKEGKAHEQVVLEERLYGPELSVMGFSDGETIITMPIAQDHKRVFDGDKGPMTGGMGAYCPCDEATREEIEFIETHIMQKTIDALRNDGIAFRGILFAGLMVTDKGPQMLEYNCRFGDPETQVVLPLLKGDLLPILLACCPDSDRKLIDLKINWQTDRHACNVVLTSGGYPGSYQKGHEIFIDYEELLKFQEPPTSDLILFHAGTKTENNHHDGEMKPTLVTNGGRVLNVVCVTDNPMCSRRNATKAAGSIHFQNVHFRRDIAAKATAHGMTYAKAGVSIKNSDKFVRNIKPRCQSTHRAGCPESGSLIGGFAAEFNLGDAGYSHPVLMMGTDAVGTKLEIANAYKQFHTIGIDLVAMCANDVLCHGAEPLAFLDYYVTGKLDVIQATQVIGGVVDGCRRAHCALVGGETAEMPGVYGVDQWDLAGTVVGALDQHMHPKLPLVDRIHHDCLVIGFPSSGLHSNGFSLVRRILKQNCGAETVDYTQMCPWNADMPLGAELLRPTKIYVSELLPLIRQGHILALAHITGGGLIENIARVLPRSCAVKLDARTWHMPNVFHWLHTHGPVSANEMLRTFNCGIGMVAVVPLMDNIQLQHTFGDVEYYKIGVVTQRDSHDSPQVFVDYFESSLMHNHDVGRRSPYDHELYTTSRISNGTTQQEHSVPKVMVKKKRVAVLISGTGSNMISLVTAAAKDPSRCCQVALVISNRADARGVTLAQQHGVDTKIVDHRKYTNREDFDRAIDQELESADIDFVCLAGFMRVLGAEFVRKWHGQLINIHPSLLPAFKGAHAHREALKAGVLYTGCTVHFVEPEVDSGAIISQAVAPVYPDDTEDTLSERVKALEHVIYPKALFDVIQGVIRWKVVEEKIVRIR